MWPADSGGGIARQSRRDALARHGQLFQMPAMSNTHDESPIRPEKRPNLLLQRVRHPIRSMSGTAGPSLIALKANY